MNDEQDKYNDYDTDDAFSSGISHSRRRRAARRNASGGSVSVKKGSEKPNPVVKLKMDKAAEAVPLPQLNEDGEIVPPKDDAQPADGGSGGKPPKKPKKKTPLRTFLTVLISIVGIYVIAVGAFAIYTYLNDDPNDNWSIEGDAKPIDKITEVFSAKLPDRTQFVIMCTDEDGTRTDTIMVGCYNSVTQGISLVSVPRDTIVSVSAANYETMREEFPEPGKRTMKINAVHHYAGNDLGPEMLVDELNSLLGTDIQYYVRVNFDAFHYLIDSIGGIEFDVPQDMDYDDPAQDLAIHLKKGLQVLDGDKAEQLVRFRKDNYGGGYFNGDLGRIEMQQNFMKTLIAKVANVDTIKKNPKAYVTAFFKYIKTNAGISDAVKYASALNKIDPTKVETYTLPGNVDYVAGISGYTADKDEVETLIYNIFERPVEEIVAEQNSEATTDSTEGTLADSKSASIQVLNGGYTNGKAGEVEAKLTADGYSVSDIGTYNDEKQAHTRIYVNKDGLGGDLVSYFSNAEVILDSNKTDGYDIVVVVGTDE